MTEDDDEIDELLLHSADPFHVSGGSFQGPLRDDDGPAAVPAVATAAAVSFPDGDDDGMMGDCAAAAAQEPDYEPDY